MGLDRRKEEGKKKNRRKVNILSVKLNLEQANNVDRLAPIPRHPGGRLTATTATMPLRCVVHTSRLASRLLALRSRSNLKVLVDIPTSQQQRLSAYLSFSNLNFSVIKSRSFYNLHLNHPFISGLKFCLRLTRLKMEQTFTAVYIVDAFTNELFSGNPAAVCCLEKVCRLFCYILIFT